MSSFIVFSPGNQVPEALDPLGDGADIVEISDLTEVAGEPQPAVLILTAELADADLLQSVPRHVAVLAKGPEARAAADSINRLFLDLDDLSEEAQLRAIRSAARVSANELARSNVASQLDELRGDLRGLNEIGMALMSERDPDVVLEMILTEARHLTTSDAGSLYLVDDKGGGTRTLHFLRAQNHSLPDLPRPDFSLPIRFSIGSLSLRPEPPFVPVEWREHLHPLVPQSQLGLKRPFRAGVIAEPHTFEGQVV